MALPLLFEIANLIILDLTMTPRLEDMSEGSVEMLLPWNAPVDCLAGSRAH